MTHSSQLTSFTPAERARMSVYKVAVARGLYTDAVSEAEESGRYRFTAEELARLVIYRAAVAAGFYTDQLDNASHGGLRG
jgi:hypothetical protein